MEISIVTTLYRSAPFIDEFYSRIVSSCCSLTDHFEVIFVNDGSPDNSLERAVELHKLDSRVVIIDLSRNFGHHLAMMTGLSYARGEKVFLIDSDLEERPELLNEFHTRMMESNCDVVYGVQRSRRGTSFEKISGALFYWLVDKLCDVKMPRNVVTARLMTRRYVKNLVLHQDRVFHISALWQLTGFKQESVEIVKSTLKSSSYSLSKRIDLAVNYICTSAPRLLSLFMYLGVLISLVSMVMIIYFAMEYFTTGHALEGWTSVIVSIWFFGGISTTFLGILGFYIAGIFTEVKRRPYTVIREIYSMRGASEQFHP